MAYIGVQPADAYTSFAVQYFTTSATDTFTLDYPVANENEIALFINNVRQEPGSSYAYTASGTTLTLSSAITGSDSMYAVFIGKAVQTVTPTLPIANFSSTGIDDNATSTAITINSSQNVGIGTSSPLGKFKVNVGDVAPAASGDMNTGVIIESGYGSRTINIGTNNTGGYSWINAAFSNNSGVADNLVLMTGATEAMRIDNSGNLLVGMTAVSGSTNGLHFRPGIASGINVTNDHTIALNRKSSDGEILRFLKDSSVVGHIGSISGNAMYVNAPNDGGGGFLFSDNASTIYPTRRTSGTVSLSDNTNDLGAAVWRFNDAYITNGVTTGSDQNEKQSIQLLTDSEIAVAKRISKGFKTFKWNSAVEEKGDNARTHTGVIAQEVQQAFTDEGLDAGNYALFMSNTYWEKEISVDAVAEELDEEGNVIVEGQDAYTYIDKKEEATEGYTERTRLGIRYPELLSFVSSAFEQRLTNIETRLETLENA